MTAARAVAAPAPAPVLAPGRAQRAPATSPRRAASPAAPRATSATASPQWAPRAPADPRFSGILQLQSALQVSTPSDPAEREAESTADAVVSMSAPSTPMIPSASSGVARRAAAPLIQRKAAGDRSVPSAVGADIQGSRGSGTPLPPSVRSFMEPRFGADFGGVRVHTGERAARLNNRLSAQAFTVGDQIFFAGGQYRPDSPEGKRLLAHELTHTIQQGAVQQGGRAAAAPPPGGLAPRSSTPVQNNTVHRRADVTVSHRTGPAVQRLGVQDALNFFADKANMIPGYRMFTILLGVNPINMSSVDRSAANILRAIVEFMPGGGLITRALDAYGVFDKVGGWIEGQLSSLGLSGASIKQSITQFLDSLSWTDIFNLGGVWERAKAIFTGPIDRIVSFVKSLASAVLQFIKDAILKPIAELASQAPGWDLLCAVLGKNPITGDAVPRTAETLIGGFMKLIGQEEIWENIKKGNAIARAYAWFQTALAGLMGFVQRIPGLFLSTLQSLEIEDIVLLPRAYIKVGKAFAGFFVEFVGWAGGTIWDLLEIVFSVVAPSVIVYVKKAAGAFKKILKDPISFVRNLVAAGKLGFNQFSGNFLKHLKKALLDWLRSALSGAGIYIPQALTLVEFGKCALSVFGISWPQIRAKIVKALGPNGETIMKVLETTFDVVVALVKGGPAAAWDVIKGKLTDLKDMIVQAIIDFVKQKIVEAAVKKIVAMLVPGGGFISAILTTLDVVMVFVQRLKQIASVVAAFIDGIAAIANGQIAGAAAKVEQVMAGLLSIVVAFLARFAGLNKIADYLVGKVKLLQAKVDQALDKGVEWIVSQAKAVLAKLMSKVKGKDDAALKPVAEAAAAKGWKLAQAKAGTEVQAEAVLLSALKQAETPALEGAKLKLSVKKSGSSWQVEAEARKDGKRASALAGSGWVVLGRNGKPFYTAQNLSSLHKQIIASTAETMKGAATGQKKAPTKLYEAESSLATSLRTKGQQQIAQQVKGIALTIELSSKSKAESDHVIKAKVTIAPNVEELEFDIPTDPSARAIYDALRAKSILGVPTKSTAIIDTACQQVAKDLGYQYELRAVKGVPPDQTGVAYKAAFTATDRSKTTLDVLRRAGSKKCAACEAAEGVSIPHNVVSESLLRDVLEATLRSEIGGRFKNDFPDPLDGDKPKKLTEHEIYKRMAGHAAKGGPAPSKGEAQKQCRACEIKQDMDVNNPYTLLERVVADPALAGAQFGGALTPDQAREIIRAKAEMFAAAVVSELAGLPATKSHPFKGLGAALSTKLVEKIVTRAAKRA